MCPGEPLNDDEIILRRIPPRHVDETTNVTVESTKEIDGGRLRATSNRLSTRPGERGLSCTRLKLTSPTMLLNGLRSQGHDPSGWFVCRFRVRDVRALGLEVIFKPTDEDAGHCEIVGNGGTLEFPNKLNSRLAKKSLILTEEEVQNLKVGDDFSY